jgi:hypothetical protein
MLRSRVRSNMSTEPFPERGPLAGVIIAGIALGALLTWFLVGRTDRNASRLSGEARRAALTRAHGMRAPCALCHEYPPPPP